jgi:hypothetical protein
MLMQSSDDPILLLGSDVSTHYVFSIYGSILSQQGGILLIPSTPPPSLRMVSFDWNDLVEPHVRKTGPQSNKIKQMQKQKTQKTHNTRETQIYVVHPVWATSTREIARSFLYYYPANEGIQPTTKPAVTSSSFSHSLLSQNTIFTLIHSRNTFPS